MLLIGNSLTKGVKEHALSSACNVTKIDASDITAVGDNLMKYTGQEPSCVVIQAITNESRVAARENWSSIPQRCLDNFDTTLDIINNRWPTCKAVVCLAPPRADGTTNSTVQNIINNSLKLTLNEKSVPYVNLDDLGFNGFPNEQYYSDPVHLNKSGTSIYAARIKKRIHRALNIQ